MRSLWLTIFGVLAIYAVGTANGAPRALSAPAANLVLGQIDLSHHTVNFGGLEALNYPETSVIDANGHLYVADAGNNRVLGWSNASALQTGAPADLVIGQPDASAATCEVSRSGLCGPSGVAVDSHGNLYVADNRNSRVLEYAAPFSSGVVVAQPASVVFAQGGSFTRCACSDGFEGGGRCGLGVGANASAVHAPRNPPPSASGLCTPDGVALDADDNLFVSDEGNNRVLIYRTPGHKTVTKGSGDTIADAVIGQVDFAHNFCNGRRSHGIPSARGLCEPEGLTVDLAGNLYVADSDNSRVLEYDTPLKGTARTGLAADRVFGQQGSFTTGICADHVAGDPAPGPDTLCAPTGVATDPAGNLYVAQWAFSNVLEYNTPLQQTGQPGSGDEIADLFIGGDGSPASASGCSPNTIPPTSANCLYTASGVSTDSAGRLYVADSSNNRALRFDTPLAGGLDGPTAGLALGQPDLMHDTANRGGLAALDFPEGSAIDSSGRLYVADFINNRVLGWDNVTALRSGASPDLVIGQPDAFYSSCTQDPTILCQPTAVAVDPAGNLYVADVFGVMEYDAPFQSGQTAGQLPDLVFGPNVCGYSRAPIGPDNLCGPGGIAFDTAGNLYIADTGNNRVLEYNTPLQKTAVDGSGDTTADHVLGQGDFSTFDCGNGANGNPGASATGLCRPTGVVVDAMADVFVADSSDNRVLEYTTPFGANAMGSAAPNANLVFGQKDFTHTRCSGDFALEISPTSRGLCDPTALSLDQKGNLFVSDTNNNRVLEYYSPLTVSSTPGSGDTKPDAVFGQASFSVNICAAGEGNQARPGPRGLCEPRGLAVDAADQLYISDAVNNRVLRFSP